MKTLSMILSQPQLYFLTEEKKFHALFRAQEAFSQNFLFHIAKIQIRSGKATEVLLRN